MHDGPGRLVFSVLVIYALVQAADPHWRQLEIKGDATPALGSAIAFHPRSRRIVRFGGTTPTEEIAAYRLMVAEWNLSPDSPLFWRGLNATGVRPGGRIRPASAYDPLADRLVIFGGAEDGPARRLTNDVYVLDNASGTTGEPVWSKLEPAGVAPEARAGAKGVLLSDGAELLVFGGCTRGPYGCDVHQNDVWLLSGFTGDEETARWRRLETQGEQPAGRSHHSLTPCPSPDGILMFGGVAAKPWNDMWVLRFVDAERPTWERLPVNGKPPPGRYAHAAACLPSENALVIFGGSRVMAPASDVWVLWPLDGTATPRWNQLSIPEIRPRARDNAHLIADEESGLLLLIGGIGIGQSFSDSWSLELGPSSAWGDSP
jgi:hypothetical protein